VITEGTITFVVDGEDRVVEAGDTYVIPGSEPHAAQTTATRKSSATTSSRRRGRTRTGRSESGARRRRWIDERASA